MTQPAESLWGRAKTALRAANHVLPVSVDTAASQAYYAAFYAISAMFALQGKSFVKHTAVEAAVHRDLVRAGIWPVELGQRFSDLVAARTIGDYGLEAHVSDEEALRAIRTAEDILKAIADAHPDAFRGLG
jgi:uncharacterized protein (UPF0332 family)